MAGIERTYHGERNAATDRPADRGALVLYVREEGQVRPLRKVLLGNPSGLEWGYTGEGPAALALSLLADALDLEDAVAKDCEAERAHQAFKRQVISRLTLEVWTLTRGETLDWLHRWHNGAPLLPEACDVCGEPDAKMRHSGEIWCDERWALFGGDRLNRDAPTTSRQNRTDRTSVRGGDIWPTGGACSWSAAYPWSPHRSCSRQSPIRSVSW